MRKIPVVVESFQDIDTSSLAVGQMYHIFDPFVETKSQMSVVHKIQNAFVTFDVLEIPVDNHSGGPIFESTRRSTYYMFYVLGDKMISVYEKYTGDNHGLEEWQYHEYAEAMQAPSVGFLYDQLFSEERSVGYSYTTTKSSQDIPYFAFAYKTDEDSYLVSVCELHLDTNKQTIFAHTYDYILTKDGTLYYPGECFVGYVIGELDPENADWKKFNVLKEYTKMNYWQHLRSDVSMNVLEDMFGDVGKFKKLFEPFYTNNDLAFNMYSYISREDTIITVDGKEVPVYEEKNDDFDFAREKRKAKAIYSFKKSGGRGLNPYTGGYIAGNGNDLSDLYIITSFGSLNPKDMSQSSIVLDGLYVPVILGNEDEKKQLERIKEQHELAQRLSI